MFMYLKILIYYKTIFNKNFIYINCVCFVIIMFTKWCFMDKKDSEFVRTTIWLPKKLHTEAKLMALLSNTTLSNIARSAISDKIKILKQQTNNSKLN